MSEVSTLLIAMCSAKNLVRIRNVTRVEGDESKIT